MKIKTVKYGRTIEVGRFGHGRSGRVWFGWEAEVEEGETESTVLGKLQDMADIQERWERKAFAHRGKSDNPERRDVPERFKE